MDNNRRRVLLWTCTLPLIPFTSQWVYAAFPILSERSHEARLRSYRSNAYKGVKHPDYRQGQICHGCKLFNRIDFGCPVFPRSSVNPQGWCDRWQAR
ncbi:MAG: hypothetical protein CMI12_16100 [Oceanospirillum sp.]|nr:hypothetical protein [Oceanospirillum sp.]